MDFINILKWDWYKTAFATTNIKGIYGMAHQENIVSRKVLEKIGMNYLGNQIFRNHKDSFYYIANSKLNSNVNECGN